jgi:hypothetical protein
MPPSRQCFAGMARRYFVQPAQNDPTWGVATNSANARALTDNVEPLRTRGGNCYPGVPPGIVKAWYFRQLRNEGAPAFLEAVSGAEAASLQDHVA